MNAVINPSIIITPAYCLSDFLDNLKCFIGEVEVKTEYYLNTVSFKYYWVFSPLHGKGIEIIPTLSPAGKIVDIKLKGTEERIAFALRFINK